MTNVLNEYTGPFAPMSNKFWRDIWIAEFSSTALPELIAKNAAMNTYWPFHGNADIFTHPVIKRGGCGYKGGRW
jgi:hypothetical protein